MLDFWPTKEDSIMTNGDIEIWQVGSLRYQTELAANKLRQQEVEGALAIWPEVHSPEVKKIELVGAIDQGLICNTDDDSTPLWIPWADIHQLLGRIPMDEDLSGAGFEN